MNRVLLILLVVLLCASCAPKPYVAQNMYASITRHKVVAILPPKVSMKLRPRQMRKTSPEKLKDMEKEMAYEVQQAMYSWILRKQRYMNYSTKFQDIKITRARLENAHIDYWALQKMDPKEIALVLSVDGLVDMDISTEKPASEAMSFLFGAMAGPANHISAVTRIYDGPTGTELWNLTRDAKGNAYSTPDQLVKMVMKKAARHFPYRQTQVDAAGNHRSSYDQ